jgi:hypothetical protein
LLPTLAVSFETAKKEIRNPADVKVQRTLQLGIAVQNKLTYMATFGARISKSEYIFKRARDGLKMFTSSEDKHGKT